MKILADLIISGAEAIKMSDIITKKFENPQRNTGEMRADKFKGVVTDEWEVDGFHVLTVHKKKCLNKHIIFLHGGGYVAEATASHRRIIEDFIRKYDLKVSFIDYPLAPENRFEKTHEVVMKAYKEITQKNMGDEFYLFGDSAGGGLALAFLQVLRDEKVIPFPKKTVLVSPWVDVSMKNEKIKKAAEIDPLLTLECLSSTAARYVGDGNPKAPIVSPIYGRMDNLGEIFLIVGTHEVLNPDCKRLKDKLIAAYGTELTFYEGEKMVHDWILAVPVFPEATKTLNMISEFYLK